MKTFNTLLTAATLALAVSHTAAADPDGVYFQAPAIAGSGCPAGTSDYALTPDGQTLSILFDAYSAAPGNKTCIIAVPVHVPNGFQVSVMTADYRGFVTGRAELSRSYFFAGAMGPTLKTDLNSSGGEDYVEHDNMITMSNTFAECGEDVNLRINSRIRTLTNRSSISVDSLDLSNGMVFHLQYRSCN